MASQSGHTEDPHLSGSDQDHQPKIEKVRAFSKRRGSLLVVAVLGTLVAVTTITASFMMLSGSTPKPSPVAYLNTAEQAYSAWQQGDFETARVFWQQAANQGDASAQYNLGLIYAQGRSVVRNPQVAQSWWQRAAKKGHRLAQHNLALSYIGGETYRPGQSIEPQWNEAISWLRKAAASGRRQGLSASQYMLGALLFEHASTPHEEREALTFLAAAAAQQHQAAQFMLGNCLFDGAGIAQNKREATALFLEAASSGHAPAQDRLARLYQNGNFVRPDKVEALAWASLASEKGFAPAVERRRVLLAELTDDEIAIAHRRIANLIAD